MKLFLTIALSILCITTFAQDGPLTKGQVKLNLGIGFGSFLNSSGSSQAVPPLSLGAEYAIDEDVTIGGIVGYSASEYYSDYLHYYYKFTHKLIGARINYYYDIADKLDLYGGAGLGYNSVGFTDGSGSSSLDESDFSTSGIFYTIHVGGRYKFTPALGAFAELGYGIAALNVGLALNFGKK